MNFDLTKSLGEYGAAIAAAGIIIVGYLNNRTSNNLDTKITNLESAVLKIDIGYIELKAKFDEIRCAHRTLAYEFEEYRRTHP